MADEDNNGPRLVGIRKLAKDLNLSIGTVSRALNGRPDVNTATRLRVQEAATAMGYVPNQSGRSLRQGTTKTIGFTFNNSADSAHQADCFLLGVAEGVQSVLAEHDLDLVLLPHPGMAASHGHLKRIVARQLVDGIIITDLHAADRRIELLQEARVPFVSLGRPETEIDIAWLDLDFAAASRLSVEHLHARGHRRIALLIPDDQTIKTRLYLEGYCGAMARAGLPQDPSWIIVTGHGTKPPERIVEDLFGLADRPTAAIVYCDIMVHCLYAKMAEMGLRVGRDLAVIGFRSQHRSRILRPDLTAFHIDVMALGQQLAAQLLSRMPSRGPAPPSGNNNVIWELHLAPSESDNPLN